ncbi:TonB-dependent receptor [Salinibacter altiplanensis]|uniref:TonB-dependent receptor n=1 Tax=Salinibacter altiplanensis TaxID=1803181 RepID=UPI000C9F7D64|nr:TonB-dependent receptor [Salinibacter altiplanensis]
MRIATTLLFAILFPVLGALSPVHGQAAELRGSVTDTQDRSVSSVNVVLERADDGEQVAGTSTAVDGTFRFADVAAGAYRLVASAVGYTKASTNVTVEEEDRLSISLRIRTKKYDLDEVVVSATRSREAVGNLASSVSVLGAQDLEAQSSITGDLGDILAQEVPGLAPSNGSLSNFGQSLRGRDPLVMIDGVPQATPLRGGGRSLRTTSPEVIKRVEVKRGASARYGFGATGGVINFITKEPTSSLNATTDVGIGGSSADVQESFAGHFHQTISGQVDGVGVVASGGFGQWGQFYDGRGNLTPQNPRGQGGLAGADDVSLFGKATVPVAESQQLTGMVQYYSLRQELEYGREPGVYDETPTSPTSDLGTIPREDPGTENVVGQIGYEHNDVLDGRVTAQAYIHDFETYFGFSRFLPGGGQSFVESTKWGLRLDATTPLGITEESQVFWGTDALRDRTAQPLVDGRIFAPEMTQSSVAPFVQLRVPVGNRLTFRGGARYEGLMVDVDDFTTLREELDTDGDGTADARNDVEGGTLTYGDLAFNAGVVVTVSDPVDVFMSFEQGFSVSEVGRVLRGTAAASVEQLDPEAKTVNSYETGLRLNTGRVSATATGYYTTSDLGSSFGNDLEIVRSPERIYGLELTADVQLRDPVAVGGSFSWLQGKNDADDDGSFGTHLPGQRIPPEKATGYVDVTPIDGWTSRIQMMYSGERDVFDDTAPFGRGDVSPYVVFDLTSQIKVGTGALEVGIENLFDNYYFPVRSQIPGGNFGDDSYTPARGRNFSLSYSVRW